MSFFEQKMYTNFELLEMLNTYEKTKYDPENEGPLSAAAIYAMEAVVELEQRYPEEYHLQNYGGGMDYLNKMVNMHVSNAEHKIYPFTPKETNELMRMGTKIKDLLMLFSKREDSISERI